LLCKQRAGRLFLKPEENKISSVLSEIEGPRDMGANMKKIFGKVISYFSQSWTELTKVAWPTRKQAIQMTIAVIIITILVGAILGFFDFGLSKGLTTLINLKK
jgi:preprotein translocase subunit SecE